MVVTSAFTSLVAIGWQMSLLGYRITASSHPWEYFPKFYCYAKETCPEIFVELNLGLCGILKRSSMFSSTHIIWWLRWHKVLNKFSDFAPCDSSWTTLPLLKHMPGNGLGFHRETKNITNKPSDCWWLRWKDGACDLPILPTSARPCNHI